jgi:hypothetical protein
MDTVPLLAESAKLKLTSAFPRVCAKLHTPENSLPPSPRVREIAIKPPTPPQAQPRPLPSSCPPTRIPPQKEAWLLHAQRRARPCRMAGSRRRRGWGLGKRGWRWSPEQQERPEIANASARVGGVGWTVRRRCVAALPPRSGRNQVLCELRPLPSVPPLCCGSLR